MIGTIEDIFDRLQEVKDGTSKTFTGRAQVEFAAITVDGPLFATTGGLWLQLQLLEPAPVREFEIEADAVQTSDGHSSARFHGADRPGSGVHVDGFFVPSNEWGIWDDADNVLLEGEVEALGLLNSSDQPLPLEDKAGAGHAALTGGSHSIPIESTGAEGALTSKTSPRGQGYLSRRQATDRAGIAGAGMPGMVRLSINREGL